MIALLSIVNLLGMLIACLLSDVDSIVTAPSDLEIKKTMRKLLSSHSNYGVKYFEFEFKGVSSPCGALHFLTLCQKVGHL